MKAIQGQWGQLDCVIAMAGVAPFPARLGRP